MVTSQAWRKATFFVIVLLHVPLAAIFFHRSLGVTRYEIWPERETFPSSGSPPIGGRHAPEAGTTPLAPTDADADCWADESTYRTSIAIALAITTRQPPGTRTPDVWSTPFFNSLMPSFCRTASGGYSYRFYLAYDDDDERLSSGSFRAGWRDAFGAITADRCPPSSAYSLRFLRCRYSARPAWSQNDAIVEAYLSGAEYFYRVNDDTVMVSGNWTERFLDTLDRFDPPRVGVVGPKHSGGNVDILTYDFTHRTHIDIHGFHYPRQFPDWYADQWITFVYEPGRSAKLTDVSLVHTMQSGQRYKNSWVGEKAFMQQVETDRRNVVRYVMAAEAGFKTRDPKKVIAMSLYSTSPEHTWGAIRNAQLLPVTYPGWSLKIYVNQSVASTTTDSTDDVDGTASSPCDRRDNVVDVLRALDAEILVVDPETSAAVPPPLWSCLVADERDVDVFLIRRATNRLSRRERAVVDHWLSSPRSKPVLAIKDQPGQATDALTEGLWAARVDGFRRLLADVSVRTFLRQCDGRAADACMDRIYSKVKHDTILYDSVTCSTPQSLPFPVVEKDSGFIGQNYDAHEQTVDKLSFRNPECEGVP